jgi:cytochrome P450
MTQVSTQSHSSQPLSRPIKTVNLLPGILLKFPFNYLRDTALENGDLVRLKLGRWSFYLVSNADYFQYVLRDRQYNFKKSELLYSTGSLVIGNGLVTSDGDFWLRQRRMMQPYFHRQQIATFATTMTDSIASILNLWLPTGKTSHTLKLMESITQISIEIMSKVVFGAKTLTVEEMISINDDQTFMIRYIALRGYTLFLPKWFPLPGAKRFKVVMARMKAKVHGIIEAGRRREIDQSTLLAMLINTVDEETESQMTNEQLFDEVMTLFLAGFETTARALTWLVYLLDRNPDIKTKVIEEIDQAVGRRNPTFEDLKNLPYCRMVFQETLRFYSPVALLPRTAVEDDELGGHKIPAGTILLMFYYGLHHNPELWDNPETFDPERFTEQRSASRSRYAYLPFSTGPRQCIGSEFAMMEGVLVLVMMMQRFHINLVPHQTIKPNLATTLTPKDEIYITVEKR